jgi:protein O-GlcNAc transferase
MEPLLFNICDRTFDVGHAFTVFYYYGSNYFHLHYDMLIPLYAAVYYHSTGKNPAGTQAFMPSVETKRLQEVDWSTTAFTDTSKYWVQMVKMITGDHTYMPLDQTTRNFGERICFSTVNFGTPRVDFSDQNLIRSFVAHVQRMLNVTVNVDVPPRVGVISRANRRRLLNEDELVAAISTLAPVDKIEFSRMSFHDQVALMQHYTVLIGMNGAGLTNGLYLPPGGVTIQLVPAGLDLNVRQFGELLRSGAGGGYMEWHSGAAEEGISGIVGDTVVDVQELVAMTRKALQLQQQHQWTIVDEL